MTSVYETIFQIQNDYFALLDQHFESERATIRNGITSGEDALQIAYELATKSPTVLSEGRQIPSVTYKALNLVREIHTFWAARSEDLYSAIQQITYVVLHARSAPLTLLDEVRTTALYIDTIVADDWLYSTREMLEDESRPNPAMLGASFLVQYVHTLALRSLCLSGVTPPILILCPSPHYANSELRNISKGLSGWLGLQYACDLYNRAFGSFEEVIDYCRDAQDIAELAVLIANPELVWGVEDTLQERIDSRLALAEDAFYLSGLGDTIPLTMPGIALVVIAVTAFDAIALQEVDNEILGLDPKVSVYHWKEYLWSLETRASESHGTPQLQENAAVAQILNLPEMEWIGNIPIQQLIQVREAGEMDELRNLIRDAKNRLNQVEAGQFTALASEVKMTLETALTEHARSLKTDAKQLRNRFGLELGALLVSGMLSGAALAFPPLAIPAALIGLGAGVGSVKDAVGLYQQWKGVPKKTKTTPIGLLWAARGSAAR